MKQYDVQLQQLNNPTPLFLGYDDTKKLPEEYLNGTILHAVTHRWTKKEMMLRFDFEGGNLCTILGLFDQMEVSEEIYEIYRATS